MRCSVATLLPYVKTSHTPIPIIIEPAILLRSFMFELCSAMKNTQPFGLAMVARKPCKARLLAEISKLHCRVLRDILPRESHICAISSNLF